MKDRRIVNRYAEAFISFAKETIGLEKAVRDFKQLKILMQNNPGFQEILGSFNVSFLEKSDFIEKVLNADFSGELRNFLKFLIERNRIDRLADIADYIRVTYAHPGETEAILVTSFPLGLNLIQEIKDKLENKLNRRLRFYIDLDASLLGGVQVIIGNTIIDGSIARRLADLKEQLLTVRI